MKMTYVAHISEDGREQSIAEHLRNVSATAGKFAEPFGAGKYAEMIGLAHDIGKYSDKFQRRIRGENIRTDHSTAGAQEIIKYCKLHAAYCIAGHHAGLPDCGGEFDPPSSGTLCGRLNKKAEEYGIFADEITLHTADFTCPTVLGRGGFTLSFWIRMLFSCLVDADYLDTETFMRGSPAGRGAGAEPKELLDIFEKHIENKWDTEREINKVRGQILSACIEAGRNSAPGLFTLTVPTGGGKTVSSLAFALNHAVSHGKKRVIYVIPYTSIIEQTAESFREILGDENVLEHHSNVDLDDNGDENGAERSLKEAKKLASENWDAPVIVTTAVQFFESLFSNKPSRCRKLHNIAESVIIFDEAQTLPIQYLHPCIRAISELVVNYGATCVLCTATQPALGPLFEAVSPSLAPKEIVKDIPSDIFRRVRYEHAGCLSDEELADALSQHRQVLCIVNSRRQAQSVFSKLPSDGSGFHLSTLMTPEHRKSKLREIRSRLSDGLPCRVVATSLIEAGVDVDFPAVYRAEAGLDSVIQAAGRCNREGKRPVSESVVRIFAPEGKYVSSLPHSMKRPHDVMRNVIQELSDISAIDAPEQIKKYFDRLHLFTGEGLDIKRIVELFEDIQRGKGLPFATVSESFHLIDQSTRSVMVPMNDEARDIAERLQSGERSRRLLRKAGLYSVNVYDEQYKALCGSGALAVVENDLAILRETSLYSEDTGLSVTEETGIAIQI